MIEGYEEAKNLRKRKIHVRRVLWRLKTSERGATYISEKKIQQCPHVRMVIRDEKRRGVLVAPITHKVASLRLGVAQRGEHVMN